MSARLVSAIKNWWNWTFVTFEEWFSYSHWWSCQMVAYGEQKTKYVKLLVEKVVEVVKKFHQWSLTREFLKQHLTEKQNGYVWSRSPMRSAHYERVDCITSFPPISESQGSLVSGWSHSLSATQSRTQSLLAFGQCGNASKALSRWPLPPRLKSSKDYFSPEVFAPKTCSFAIFTTGNCTGSKSTSDFINNWNFFYSSRNEDIQ